MKPILWVKEQGSFWLLIYKALWGICNNFNVNALGLSCTFLRSRFSRILHDQLKQNKGNKKTHFKEKCTFYHLLRPQS